MCVILRCKFANTNKKRFFFSHFFAIAVSQSLMCTIIVCHKVACSLCVSNKFFYFDLCFFSILLNFISSFMLFIANNVFCLWLGLFGPLEIFFLSKAHNDESCVIQRKNRTKTKSQNRLHKTEEAKWIIIQFEFWLKSKKRTLFTDIHSYTETVTKARDWKNDGRAIKMEWASSRMTKGNCNDSCNHIKS